jgi:hypothetical protein
MSAFSPFGLLLCQILPPGTEFPPNAGTEIGGVECRLLVRSPTVDGRSRDGFRWPSPGGWTPTVDADPSDNVCSYGLHACGAGGLGSGLGFGSGRVGQIIAVPVDSIVHDDTKVRFGRAYVLGLFDLPALIRAGLFAGADLTGANLSWADLTGAVWGESTVWPKGFTPASTVRVR